MEVQVKVTRKVLIEVELEVKVQVEVRVITSNIEGRRTLKPEP